MGQAGEPWAAEVPLAYDPVTDQAMPIPTSNGHRDYSAVPAGWIAGTSDASLVGAEGVAVIDWKTGFNAPAAADSAQLRTLALMAARLHGKSAAWVAIVHCQPDGIRIDAAEMDSLDLAVWSERLEELVLAIPGAPSVAGPHCRATFCPYLGICPATAQALEMVADTIPVPANHRRSLPLAASDIAGPDEAAAMYQALRSIKARLDLAWEALRQYADSAGGVPVGDKVWIKSVSSRESVDISSPEARNALRTVLGDDWEAAVEVSTTKTRIAEAARIAKARTGIAAAKTERAVLDALREVGAVRSSESVKYDERKVRE